MDQSANRRVDWQWICGYNLFRFRHPAFEMALWQDNKLLSLNLGLPTYSGSKLRLRILLTPMSDVLSDCRTQYEWQNQTFERTTRKKKSQTIADAIKRAQAHIRNIHAEDMEEPKRFASGDMKSVWKILIPMKKRMTKINDKWICKAPTEIDASRMHEYFVYRITYQFPRQNQNTDTNDLRD